MKHQSDLEKEKFSLENGEVIIQNESVSYQSEVGAGFSVDDLERLKFNSLGQLRVAPTF